MSAPETLPDRDIDPGEAPRLLPGQHLGRYVILQPLGAGAMGVVYAAYDPQLDRKIAIKLLQHDDQYEGSDGERRLLREAQAMARVSHPNVVAVHDVGTHETLGGGVYVAMEFVSGCTLREWFEQAPRSTEQILAVMRAAGQGLAAVHAQGLIHRDFKPDNVMLDDAGRVRVMDFGLARRSTRLVATAELMPTDEPPPSVDGNELEAIITRAGAVMGTPAYMAPEQLRGHVLGPHTDQFAFCVTLFEGLYGTRPFAGKTVADLAVNVCSGEQVDPPPDTMVPPWLRRAVLRGLEVNPDRRWPNMEALLAALDHQPSRLRRRAMAAVAVLSVGGVGYGLHVLHKRRQQHACMEASEAIAEVWDDSVRARITESFVGTGSPIASGTAARTVALLDDYAADWRHEHASVCRQARVDKTRSAGSHAGVNACLMRARGEMSVLVELLTEADVAMVHHAVQLASSLPPARHCARRDDDAPDDRSEATAAIRRSLTKARLLQTSGQYPAALAAADDALERAEQLDAPPLVIEARRRRGGALSMLGRYDEANEQLQDALFAAQAIGRDDLLAEAATVLVGLTPKQGVDAQQGLLWARMAEAAMQRRGESLTARHGDLLVNLGNVYGSLGDHQAALEAKQRALDIFVTQLGRQHPRVSLVQGNIGNSHLLRGRFDDAEQAYLQALDGIRSSLGEQHPDAASSLGNLASVYVMRGELDDAIEVYREALAIRQATLGLRHPKTAITEFNLGNAYWQAKQLERAAYHFQTALDSRLAALGPVHPDVAQSHESLGLMAFEREDFLAALSHLRRALRALPEGSSPPGRFQLLVNLSEILMQLDRGDDADTTLAEAEPLLDHASVSVRLRAHLFTIKAHRAEQQGDKDAQRRYLEQTRDELRRAPSPDAEQLDELDDQLARLDEAESSGQDRPPRSDRAAGRPGPVADGASKHDP